MTLQLTGKNDVRLAALAYVIAVLEMLQVNVDAGHHSVLNYKKINIHYTK